MTEHAAPTALDLRARWRSGKLYLLAGAIYLVSRLVIVVAINVASHRLPPWKPDLWQPGPRWYDHLLRWDSEWYAGIAADGYQYSGVAGNPGSLQSVVFFPLFPLISRLVARASGLSPAHALLVVANLAALAAMLLLCKLARRKFGDRVALLAVAFVSFFPGSLFLSAGYSEPLTLLLVLSCFVLLQDQRYLAASTCAGLAAATRSVGIVLAPVLVWELWQRYRREGGRFVVCAAICLALASSGLWLYMIYLGAAFGQPFAFLDAQSAWHGATSFSDRLIAALGLQPFRHFRFADFSPAGLDQWFFILFFLGSAAAWWRLSASFGLFSFGVLMLPYLSLSGGPSGLTSMTRFGLLAFPVFIVLAELCRKWLWLCMAIISIFALMLGVYAALFGQWYWVD
jgi:hypothetical protein